MNAKPPRTAKTMRFLFQTAYVLSVITADVWLRLVN
jgi:hypothetical protein